MKAGRRPDPNHIRRLKGKKELINREEQVTFDVGVVMPPSFIKGEAALCWKRMATELTRAEIFSKISRDKLARYCIAWQDYHDIMLERDVMGKKRLYVTSKNWRTFMHWNQVLRQCEQVMSNFETEYGLTPSSAMRIRKPSTAKPVDEFGDFLLEGAKEE